jgi:hypothetical protein
VKKGKTKLLLFHICGKLSNDPTSFGDLSYTEPAQGMKVVLDSAQPACVTSFSNLIRNTSATAKELDLMNIRSRLTSIVFINKATALHLLQGNLATEGVTLFNNKANSINLSLFPPQQNSSMINRERSNNLTACSENNMDIADTHTLKTNLAITCICSMVDMTNFSSLCINCNTIISAIIGSTGPQPLYCQILLKFVPLLNNPDFHTWYAATKGSMPSLHWHILLPQAYLQPLCQVCNGLWQHQHHDQIASIGGAQHQAPGQGADSSKGIRRPAIPCAVHKQPHPHPCRHHIQVLHQELRHQFKCGYPCFSSSFCFYPSREHPQSTPQCKA